jgi:hypothetical protein
MKRLFAIVLLIALLVVGGSARAGVLTPSSHASHSASPSSLEEELEGEIEELLEEELEPGELEEIEGELEEIAEEAEELLGEGDKGEEPAVEEAEEELEECVLDFADATVVVDSRSDTLRITIHYRSEEPVGIAIGLRSHGSKGAFSLGTSKTRFGRAGVFHRTEHLSPGQTAKLMKARALDLELEPRGFEEACEGLFEEALSTRRSSGAKRFFS